MLWRYAAGIVWPQRAAHSMDPKSKRSAVSYTGGRVVGALGLLEYLFGANDVASGYTVKVDARGRRRLTGLMNRTAAVGGKQLLIQTKDGKEWQVHYSGTLVDWALHGVPKLNASVVSAWSTARGKQRSIA